MPHVKIYSLPDDLRPGKWQVVAEVIEKGTRQLDYGLTAKQADRAVRTASRAVNAVGATIVA